MGGGLYDLHGRHILRRHEEQELEFARKGVETIEVCSSAYPFFTLPPHSCPVDVGGSAHAILDYALDTGQYIFTPVPYPNGPRPDQGLLITITE